MNTSDYSQLKGVAVQSHITVIAGPGAGQADKALSSAGDMVAGTTLIKIDAQADVGQAVLLALRTGPAVLAIAGKSAFVSEILGGLLALKEADIRIPPVVLLSAQKDAAAPLALKTAGKPVPILEKINTLIQNGSLPEHLLSIPLLQITMSPGVSRFGLIFGVGAYAEGLKDNFQGLFDTVDLVKLHMVSAPPAPAREGVSANNPDLARIAPDTGGTLTTYLHGALFSALPLPLLNTKRPTADKPLIYLATEKNRKARMAALRAFRGKLDRAEPYYGVHLTRISDVSIRMQGPHSLDGAMLDLPETFALKPSPPLEMLDLSEV